MPRFTKRLAQRDIRNWQTFASGGTAMEQAVTRKTGRQKEAKVNDAVKEWARLRGGVLHRNRRGMVDLPNGGKMPIGLGPNGWGDNVGWLTIQITPGMVGRRIAVYAMIESKVKGGADNHQQVCIEQVRDAGGIAGVATNAEDCEVILATWGTRP